MGNAITKEYDVEPSTASGGCGMLWKIISAKKKTTGERLSVFVFDKTKIDSKYKGLMEASLGRLRLEISNLAKLRHPTILRIVQTCEETRTELFFVTEPVFGSLANLIGKDYRLIEKVTRELSDFKLHDLEMRSGVLQISSFLTFAANEKLAHLNFAPENIFIAADGLWKVGGFGFAEFLKAGALSPPPPSGQPQQPQQQVQQQLQHTDFKLTFDTSFPWPPKPNIAFMAPELVTAATAKDRDPSADIFSFACLVFYLYNGASPLGSPVNEQTYQQAVSALPAMPTMGQVPGSLVTPMRSMLATIPSMRPKPEEVLRANELFGDITVKTLLYIGQFVQKTDQDKAQFLKGLLTVLDKFPQRIREQKVLAPLLQELKNAILIPFILPCVFACVGFYPENENSYIQHEIIPALVPVLKMNEPVHIPLIILANIKVLISRTSHEQQQQHVLPAIVRMLADERPNVMDAVLTNIPVFAPLLEYTTVKNTLVPRLLAMFEKASTLTVQTRVLSCLQLLCKTLDKDTLESKVMATLDAIPLESPATLLVAALALAEAVAAQVGGDVVALRVLPFVSRRSVCAALSPEQFRLFTAAMRTMVGKVEDFRTGEIGRASRFQQEGLIAAAAADGPTTLQGFSALVGASNPPPASSAGVPGNPFLPAAASSSSCSSSSPMDSLSMYGEEKKKQQQQQPMQQQQQPMQPKPIQAVAQAPKPAAGSSNISSTAASGFDFGTFGSAKPAQQPQAQSQQQQSSGNFNLFSGLQMQPSQPLMATPAATPAPVSTFYQPPASFHQPMMQGSQPYQQQQQQLQQQQPQQQSLDDFFSGLSIGGAGGGGGGAGNNSGGAKNPNANFLDLL